MKTIQKLERYFNLVMSIRYENEHGGAYAYIQFLAYTRVITESLQAVKSAQPQLDAIEGISWLFNECLASSFKPRHQAIFENKRREFEEIFKRIRYSLQKMNARNLVAEKTHHAQAA